MLGLGSDLQGLMYQSPQRDLDLDLDEWDTRIVGVPTLVARLLVGRVRWCMYPTSLPREFVVKWAVGCVHLQVLIQWR